MWNVPALQLRCRSAGRAAGRRRSGRISSEQRIGGEEVRHITVQTGFAKVPRNPIASELLSRSIFVTVRLQPPETANILGTDLGTKPGGREWDG